MGEYLFLCGHLLSPSNHIYQATIIHRQYIQSFTVQDPKQTMKHYAYHIKTSLLCRLRADPSRRHYTNMQNPSLQQNCLNFWTNDAVLIYFEIYNFLSLRHIGSLVLIAKFGRQKLRFTSVNLDGLILRLWNVILDLCSIGQLTYVHLDTVPFYGVEPSILTDPKSWICIVQMDDIYP